MTLLNTLKKNPNIRKIFGERELLIIEKQLLGVKLSPSEVTRLSRDIRKKFDAVKELSKYLEEFSLKKGSEIKKLIEESKEVIMESNLSNRINKIVLFGSAAENKSGLTSDIDIAVYFKDITNQDALRFRRDVLGKLNEKIDVQVYNTLPLKLKKEIDKKGNIIYEQKNKK